MAMINPDISYKVQDISGIHLAPCTLHLKPSRGFALLIAVIFMSVMLSLGLALGSLGYKQQVLASSSIESQYAFYAADAALECALYADQQLGLFSPFPAASQPISSPSITCDNQSPPSTQQWSSSLWVIIEQIPIDSLTSHPRCADVTVYKYSTGATYIFSQGYDVSCNTVASPSGARFVSRGINAHY